MRETPEVSDKKLDKGFLKRPFAKIAQLVEHDLAKVGVAGSSPVFRSKCPGGGIGRRATLRG